MIEAWVDVLRQSFQDIWMGVADFIPYLIGAVIIFIVGWVVGSLLGQVVAQIIKVLPVDTALRHARVEEVLKRAGFNLDSGKFLGALVKWFVIIVFLVASLDVLGLQQVNLFLEKVLLYLPDVIVAVFIR